MLNGVNNIYQNNINTGIFLLHIRDKKCYSLLVNLLISHRLLIEVF